MKLLAFMLLLITPACAAPFEVTVTHVEPTKITGTITLREPSTDEILGTYEFVSGGRGRGAVPFGKYAVGGFLGNRWDFHAPDAPDGEMWDERVRDMRFDMQIHANSDLPWTLGCIGILGRPQTWTTFSQHLHHIIDVQGVVRFEIKQPESAIAVAVGK